MIRSLLKRKITGDLVFLYAAFFAGFVVPVLTIPYLTRVLGKPAWSQLVFVQGFCALAGVPLAWGFGYHGTRLVAKFRDDREKVGTICAEILSARLLLLAPVILLAIGVIAMIPKLQADIPLAIFGVTATVLNAFSVGWILQGLDRMRWASILDLTVKLLATLPIFLIVKSPAHAHRVVLLQAASVLLSLGIGYAMLRRWIPIRAGFARKPSAVFGDSAGMFLFTLSGTIVNQTNAFFFGLFAPLPVVGIYAGAEKIIRAACALVGPFSTALHTKINYRASKDPAAAARFFVLGTALLFCLAVALSLLIWFSSDFLVAHLLGPEFHESAKVLRMIAILPVFNWLSYSLNLNWFIVRHMDRSLNLCVLFAAAATFVSTCVLVPLYSLNGMAFSVISSEAALLLALLFTLVRKRQNPLRIAFARNDSAS